MPMLDDDQIDNADLSKECAKARRELRRRLLQINDKALTDLYYKTIVLSEHEAARLARNEILERSHLSNRAEA